MQVAAQPDEALELYMAADRPVAALALVNVQVSAALPVSAWLHGCMAATHAHTAAAAGAERCGA